jgi:hypothetical protein
VAARTALALMGIYGIAAVIDDGLDLRRDCELVADSVAWAIRGTVVAASPWQVTVADARQALERALADIDLAEPVLFHGRRQPGATGRAEPLMLALRIDFLNGVYHAADPTAYIANRSGRRTPIGSSRRWLLPPTAPASDPAPLRALEGAAPELAFGDAEAAVSGSHLPGCDLAGASPLASRGAHQRHQVRPGHGRHQRSRLPDLA